MTTYAQDRDGNINKKNIFSHLSTHFIHLNCPMSIFPILFLTKNGSKIGDYSTLQENIFQHLNDLMEHGEKHDV